MSLARLRIINGKLSGDTSYPVQAYAEPRVLPHTSLMIHHMIFHASSILLSTKRKKEASLQSVIAGVGFSFVPKKFRILISPESLEAST